MVFEGIERNNYQNDWIAIVFLGALLLLFIINILQREKIQQVVKLLLYPNAKFPERKEFSIFFNYTNLLLFTLHLIVFSLLIYFSISYFDKSASGFSGVKLYGVIVLGYLVYAILYYFSSFVLRILFEIKQTQEQFYFLKFCYLNTVVFWILPFLFFVAYARRGNETILKITLVITSLLMVWRFLFLLSRNKNLIFNKLFYFILYLCTLEIAPIVVVFKLMD